MFPRWLSLAFLSMLVYVAYSASQSGRPAPIAKTLTPVIDEKKYPVLVEMTDMESWKRKLDPDYAAQMNCALDKPKAKNGLKFSAVEQVVGEGIAAKCGDKITIAMTAWNSAGAQTFSGENTLALGSRQVAAGLDFGLLGIRIGGERTLTVPPYALTRGKATTAHESMRKALPIDAVAVVQVKRIK